MKNKINKTKICPFNKSPKRIKSIPLCLQGTEISIKDAVKYLKYQIIQNMNCKIIYNLPRLYPTFRLERYYKEHIIKEVISKINKKV